MTAFHTGRACGRIETLGNLSHLPDHVIDGKTGRPIIVYGVLTDGQGRPVAVQVYPGDTGDPATVPDQVAKLSRQFGLPRIVLVGDRGMLTQAQINTLKKHPGLGWISALRSDAIRGLLAVRRGRVGTP